MSFIYLCLILFLLTTCSVNVPPTPQALVETSEIAKYMAGGSFIVSVMAFISSYITNDTKKSIIAGSGGILFLIVSMIILLSQSK